MADYTFYAVRTIFMSQHHKIGNGTSFSSFMIFATHIKPCTTNSLMLPFRLSGTVPKKLAHRSIMDSSHSAWQLHFQHENCKCFRLEGLWSHHLRLRKRRSSLTKHESRAVFHSISIHLSLERYDCKSLQLL